MNKQNKVFFGFCFHTQNQDKMFLYLHKFNLFCEKNYKKEMKI